MALGFVKFFLDKTKPIPDYGDSGFIYGYRDFFGREKDHLYAKHYCMPGWSFYRGQGNDFLYDQKCIISLDLI